MERKQRRGSMFVDGKWGGVYDVVGEHRDQLSVHTCTCVDEEIKNI